MKVKQVELSGTGGRMISWIDSMVANKGTKVTLNLGDGQRSPVMQIINVWHRERDIEEIKERQVAQRDFGGSIK